jgi:hemolysin III
MYHGERFNSITHLVGAALALTGATLLVTRAALDGDPWKIVSFSVFGVMLVLLYTVSTLYHSISQARVKAVLRRLDHCAIFMLIAGTYTPFTLVTLRGPLGWALFAAIWLLAAAGIWMAWRQRSGRDPSAWPYVVMGWIGATVLVPLTQSLGIGGLLWLLAGGALYSAGVLFYVNDRRWRHAHGIWHLFVLAGSSAHVVTVLTYVD